MKNRTAEHAAEQPETATPQCAPNVSRTPGSPRTISAADLGSLRMRIFEQIRSGDLMAFHQSLPEYASLLNQLLASCARDSSTEMRLESDHITFFEQVKAVLVTNRIQLRLELERVNASRHYSRVPPTEPIGHWQG